MLTTCQSDDELWDAFVETKRAALTLAMRRTFEKHHEAALEKVMVGLRRELERIGLPVSAARLLPYATSISLGNPIVFK